MLQRNAAERKVRKKTGNADNNVKEHGSPKATSCEANNSPAGNTSSTEENVTDLPIGGSLVFLLLMFSIVNTRL